MSGSGTLEHETYRASEDLIKELDGLANTYGMNRSQLTRLIIEHGVSTIKTEGLEAVVSTDE
jgi:metal-responsive CopG/Arc/MetJ family transcriptional regulator